MYTIGMKLNEKFVKSSAYHFVEGCGDVNYKNGLI